MCLLNIYLNIVSNIIINDQIDEPETIVQPEANEDVLPAQTAVPLKAAETMPALNTTPVVPDNIQPSMAPPPLRSTNQNISRPSAHVTPTQHSVISVDTGTSSRVQDHPFTSSGMQLEKN